MDLRVRTAVEIMRAAARDGRDVAFDELARSINLSRSRLRHLFKAETGLTPARYLHMLRMERARTLIETTFLSVKQVMNGVGINDESHFVRDFKRAFGRSPKRHRADVWARADASPQAHQPPGRVPPDIATAADHRSGRSRL